MTVTTCPEFVCITVAIPPFPPRTPDGWQRLRKLLKALIRSYGLRCVDISESKRKDETI